ncbi:MAG TPA: hypothetical protein VN455_05940 [Methanotrichaceae archaeon]|nr:hypothetical protein [Methanotrichaceae archaeon]
MGLKYLISVIAVLLFFLPGALGLNIGGGAAVSTSDADSSAQGVFSADDALISSASSSQGLINLDEVHKVIDAAGKEAMISLKVDQGAISNYKVELRPKEGQVSAASSLTAKESLTVKNANRILAKAQARNGAGDSADVGVEVQKGSLIGYQGEATATDKSAGASQSADTALGSFVELTGAASRGLQKSSVNMGVSGLTGQDAEFIGGVTSSSAGSPKSSMDGHLKGAISGLASVGDQVRARDSKGGRVDCDMTMSSAVNGAYKKVDGSGTFYTGGFSGGKIQSAVNAAWDGDSISLGPGVYKENVVIDKSLSIYGSGPGRTVVDGGAKAPVFTIGPSGKVVLSGMTIRNGDASINDIGGGIYNKGQTTVTNCEITGNRAYYGAGIGNDGGLMSVVNSRITGNRAESSGGGILNNDYSTMTVTDSYITDNIGTNSGGGFTNWGTITAKNIHVSGNSASFYNGGGAANGGKMTVTGSEFTNNKAENGFNGGSGGGLVNWGMASMTGCKITGNTAYDGGGICNIATQGGVLVLASTSVSGNKPNDIIQQ